MLRPLAAGLLLLALAGLAGCGKSEDSASSASQQAPTLSPEEAARRARVAGLAAQWTGEIDYTSFYSPSGVRAAATERVQFNPQDPYSGLPQTEGFLLVYASCIACHETRLVMSQQKTERQWQQTIDQMIHKHGMVPPPPEQRAQIVAYLTRYFGR